MAGHPPTHGEGPITLSGKERRWFDSILGFLNFKEKYMIILDLFFAIFIVVIILFGRIEFTSSYFKVFININGWVQPLISISYGKGKSSEK